MLTKPQKYTECRHNVYLDKKLTQNGRKPLKFISKNGKEIDVVPYACNANIQGAEVGGLPVLHRHMLFNAKPKL